jgi:hypothetical protein
MSQEVHIAPEGGSYGVAHEASRSPNHFSCAAAETLGPTDSSDRERVAFLARAELRRAALRMDEFEPALGQDCVWNMLLEMVASRAEGRKVSVKCLQIASRGPQSSALRWIRQLEADGHLSSETDQHDRRRRFLRISDNLAARVSNHLLLAHALNRTKRVNGSV